MESIGYTPATIEIVSRRSDPETSIHHYTRSWPQTFEQVAGRIRSALGSSVLRMEHVGSTSVPELSAKPIIDILVEVSDPSDEGGYVPGLEELGFTLFFRQPRWHGHRFLACALDDRGVEVNIHVHRAGCKVAGEFMAFRDFLRNNAWAREEYAEAKKTAALASNEMKGGRLQYQMKKGAVLARLKAIALKEQPVPECADCRVG